MKETNKSNENNLYSDPPGSPATCGMWNSTSGLQPSILNLPAAVFFGYFLFFSGSFCSLYVFYLFYLICFFSSCGKVVGAPQPLVLVPSYTVAVWVLRLYCVLALLAFCMSLCVAALSRSCSVALHTPLEAVVSLRDPKPETLAKN